ncbi:MAG: hypothetical protein Q4E07_00735 [Eubacteriales bacterium]|nr:hypothetical protein [Eubacteriales bacterium]
MFQKNIAGKTVLLKADCDFNFLNEFDNVFAVYDELTSGNICFGAEKNGRKYFLKYAGAQPKNYIGKPEKAIERLTNAAGLYETFKHEALANLVYTQEFPKGFLMVFDFIYSIPIGPLTLYKKQIHSLPLPIRLKMLDNVFDFFNSLSHRDYIAAGLSDSKFLFDIKKSTLKLSSINGFVKMPFQNTGRLQGSSVYLAPECYQNTMLDERVTVYSMGVLAMNVLGGALTGTDAKESLYYIAKKALYEDRALRIQSTEKFLKSWRKAVLNIPFNL